MRVVVPPLGRVLVKTCLTGLDVALRPAVIVRSGEVAVSVSEGVSSEKLLAVYQMWNSMFQDEQHSTRKMTMNRTCGVFKGSTPIKVNKKT